ncbi:MAG: NRDE family protein [Acidobacteriota bacterium]|nr:NRDE family protein [Acidobacteriota bacterium]
MCTLSWLFFGGGYELHFNRDESRARREAAPPRVVSGGDCSFVAPVDGEAGGTWIAVNAAGIGLALLNRYDREGRSGERSRGLLVAELASLGDLRHLGEALGSEQARALCTLRPGRLSSRGRGALLDLGRSPAERARADRR